MIAPIIACEVEIGSLNIVIIDIIKAVASVAKNAEYKSAFVSKLNVSIPLVLQNKHLKQQKLMLLQ